ncbi:uncharacterized protein C8R40DRAFT_1075190 [Lentinula edodes]|uniref:uncharacterized protein n=1 Tax=Lentinula edodes TaxID=5353 RepID=UPI001E8EDB2C|nr:uncharacterized protein C8R40DRAFT_1075190 [Lentinula edodes]KAH7868001.1 hypothetical protein C8R40DRAFT_1075190 [Lentinula edodes]
MMERKLRNQEESEPEARHPKPTALFQLFAGQICQYHLVLLIQDTYHLWIRNCRGSNAVMRYSLFPKRLLAALILLSTLLTVAASPIRTDTLAQTANIQKSQPSDSQLVKIMLIRRDKESRRNLVQTSPVTEHEYWTLILDLKLNSIETYFGYRTRFETNQEGTRGSWVNEAKMHTNTGNIFVVVREPKGIILGSFSASQVARRKIYLRLTKAPVKPNLWYIDQILAMLETYLPNELGISVDLDLTPHGIWVPLVMKMVNAGCTGARKLVVGNHEANLSGGPLKQSSKPQFGVGPSV